MSHVVLLNLVFFVPAICGMTASAVLVYRYLQHDPPSTPPDDGGGAELPFSLPSAGPNDLARSA